MVKNPTSKLTKVQNKILFHMIKNNYNTSSGIGISCFDNIFSDLHKNNILLNLESLVENGYLRPLTENQAARFTDDGFYECHHSFKYKKFIHSLNPVGRVWLYKLIWIIITALIVGGVSFIIKKLTE